MAMMTMMVIIIHVTLFAVFMSGELDV